MHANTVLLSRNLQEIYSVLPQCKEGCIPLVSNFWGTHVYNATCGWGRLWTLFYDIFFRFAHLKDNNLKKSLVNTYKIFLRVIPSIESDIKVYQKLLSNYMVTGTQEGAYPLAKERISYWSHRILPFLHKSTTTNYAHIIQGLLIHFEASTYKNITALLTRYSHISNLEDAMHGCVPPELLQWIYPRSSTTDMEDRNLQEWLQKVNSHGTAVNTNIFHEALKSLHNHAVDFLKPKKGDALPSLGSIEWKLQTFGCEQFKQGDKAHINWRDGLRPGDAVYCNGKAYILEKRLSNHSISEDYIHTYTLKNNPDKVIKIGNNKSILLMIKKIPVYQLGEISTSSFSEVDADGTCALMPLYQSAINNKEISGAIVLAIKDMLAQDYCPQGFCAKYLVNDFGTLRYLGHLHRAPFDYNLLEQFIYDVSGGDRVLFKNIMEVSGLFKHRTARFYQAIVKKGLLNPPVDIKLIACNFDIESQQLLKRAEELLTVISKVDRDDAARIWRSYHESCMGSLLFN